MAQYSTPFRSAYRWGGPERLGTEGCLFFGPEAPFLQSRPEEAVSQMLFAGSIRFLHRPDAAALGTNRG